MPADKAEEDDDDDNDDDEGDADCSAAAGGVSSLNPCDGLEACVLCVDTRCPAAWDENTSTEAPLPIGAG